MGKKKNETKQQQPQNEEQQQEEPQQIEGKFLLGKPKFKKLENGRYKCVETGHELPADGRESYAQTKHCRLGLIDSALSRNKPPLNMFNQDPLCRSKLVCKLTGHTVNKIEEHIWKHINGRRFLSMLDNEEAGAGKEEEAGVGKEEEMDDLEVVDSEGKPVGNSKSEQDGSKKKKKKKKKNKNKKAEEKDVSEIISEVRDPEEKDNNSEEDEFWMPPVGDRWDFDDGKDRWGSDLESDVDPEDDDEIEADATVEEINDAQELSKRTKRMSTEIEPSDLASPEKKKKKKKTEST